MFVAVLHRGFRVPAVGDRFRVDPARSNRMAKLALMLRARP